MIVCRRFPEGKTDIPTLVLVLGEAHDSLFLYVRYMEMSIIRALLQGPILAVLQNERPVRPGAYHQQWLCGSHPSEASM